MMKHLPKTMCMLFVLLAFSSVAIHAQEAGGVKDVVEVPNLATLRTQNADNSTVYKVTGEIILTHQNGNRNQKYFQDDSGAILVDDAAGIITTAYKEYDAISGLTGKLSAYQNLLQLIPVEDPGPAASSSNEVEPLELTLSQVTSEHQARLVIIKDVSFGSPPKANFAPSTNYSIYDESGTGVIRTPNAAAGLDYFGAPVPEEATDVIALVNQFGSTMQLMPRKLADMGITVMPNIAALRNQAADNETIYTLIGEVIMTHKNGNRNQKYFQDATGAILIDDSPGIITTSYNEYDGVTGLTGKLSAYAGMLQLIPTEDPGAATSTGLSVEPLVVTLADLNPEHQAMLVRINEVTFDTPANPNFSASTNYPVSDPGGTGLVRTPNANAGLDYIGTPVPTTDRDIIAIVNQFNQSMQLMPRSLEDFIATAFYTVTFNIKDEDDAAISDAIVTFDGNELEAGQYVVEDVASGTYAYSVSKEGYETFDGQVEVSANMTVDVVLESIGEGIVVVPDLATLRSEGLTDGTIYRVSGNIIMTHQNGNRNQKYFQDDSGAILVDDAGGIITTAYKEYDAIQGLTGRLSVYQNLLQLVPVSDPGPAVSSGNTVVPLELTLDQITPAHQAQLVIIKDVSFGTPPTKENFAPSRNYNIYDASGMGVIRTPNAAAGLDYFGAPVPEEATDVIALVNQFGSTMQLMPRKLADMGITDMPNIAALRNQAADNSTIYTIIGEVVMTHKNGNRNQKYFQDASGAILIDDSPGVITTSYDEYDGVTGLTGKLSVYAGMLQLIPTEDPGPASSTGVAVEPLLITLEDLGPQHQSMLVRVNEVTFDTPANPDFSASTNYPISDPSGTGLVRTPNANAGLDYFGTPVPTTDRDIIAIVNQFNQSMQLMPRSLSDFISLDFYTVSFIITDENGNSIPDAVITLDEDSFDPGEYILEDIPGGTYTYLVSKAGYWEKSGTLLIEEDVSKEVMLIAVDDHLVTDFPMTEDFSGSFPPTGWASISAGAAGGWQVGNNAAYHSFTPAGQNADSWLITPQIQLPDNQVMLLKFLERNQFMADYGYSGVWISEGSGLPQNDDFVELYESSSSFVAFTEGSISLRDYMGKVVYIAFVYQGEDAHNWWLDQVIVEQAPDVIEVPNLAALREGATDGTKYRVTGNVILTHQNGNRNQKYVQDATAAILIDDAPGRITTSYNTYDAISGLTGTLSVYASLLQFIPDEDPGPATSTGNTVEPLELKLNEITPQHQAQLIVVRNVRFGTPETKATFAASTSYNIFDESGTGVIRTPNVAAGLDYFGTDIPETPKDIIAVVSQFNQDMQIMPRALSDFMDPSTSVPVIADMPEVKLYPNPAQTHFYLESAEMIEYVRIFSLNGQLIQQKSVFDYAASVDASWLNNGLYIIQVLAADRVITHKLQIVR